MTEQHHARLEAGGVSGCWTRSYWSTRTQRGFVLPGFLMSPTGIMATVIVVLSLSNVLFYKLWQGKVDEFANFKSAVEAQTRAFEAEAERVRVESEKITADVSLAWQRSLDHLRRNPAVRVRNAGCEGGMSQVPATGLVTPSAASQQGFDPIVIDSADCEARLNGAAQDALQLWLLQSWVIRQHNIKPESK